GAGRRRVAARAGRAAGRRARRRRHPRRGAPAHGGGPEPGHRRRGAVGRAGARAPLRRAAARHLRGARRRARRRPGDRRRRPHARSDRLPRAVLEADLAARDFTVDALAVPLGTLVTRGRAPIVDPTGGLADLAARRLRPAGPSVLDDDPLRALRAVRLEATLGLRLTAPAARAVRRAAPGLERVSPERVRDELLILLALPDTARALRRADALGLLAVVVQAEGVGP